MAKLSAQELLDYLLELGNDYDLSKVSIYYRTDRDSDEEVVNFVEQDLYDEDTNSELISIMLLNDGSDI